MKWFRHYSNAHKGQVMQSLIPIFGKAQGYGLFFLLVEYLTDKWDGKSDPKFRVFKSELRSFLGLKQNKLSLFLECLQNQTSFSFTETEFFFEIEFPKLLEIRHRDALDASTRLELRQHKSGGEQNRIEKNRKEKNVVVVDLGSKRGEATTAAENSFSADVEKGGAAPAKETAPPQQREKRFPVIDELRGNALLDEVLPFITDRIQRSWVARYERTWLIETLVNACEFYMTDFNASNAADIENWGVKLTGWVRREKKPRLVHPGVFNGQPAIDPNSDAYIFGEEVKS